MKRSKTIPVAAAVVCCGLALAATQSRTIAQQSPTSGAASQKVRMGNYERVFNEGRKKVRAWETANVKTAAK